MATLNKIDLLVTDKEVYRLFVDDGADIQSFGHGDIVQIVY